MRLVYGESVLEKVLDAVAASKKKPLYVYLDDDEWNTLIIETNSYPAVQTIEIPVRGGLFMETIKVKREINDE